MFITIFVPSILFILDLFLSDWRLSVYRPRAEPDSFDLFCFVCGRTRPLRAAQVHREYKISSLLERYWRVGNFYSAVFHSTECKQISATRRGKENASRERDRQLQITKQNWHLDGKEELKKQKTEKGKLLFTREIHFVCYFAFDLLKPELIGANGILLGECYVLCHWTKN